MASNSDWRRDIGARARQIRVDKIELGGLVARNVETIVVPGNGLNVDGLLGATFLDQFEIVATDKSFRFRPRGRGAVDPRVATETSSASPQKTRTRTATKQRAARKTEEHGHDHERACRVHVPTSRFRAISGRSSPHPPTPERSRPGQWRSRWPAPASGRRRSRRRTGRG